MHSPTAPHGPCTRNVVRPASHARPYADKAQSHHLPACTTVHATTLSEITQLCSVWICQQELKSNAMHFCATGRGRSSWSTAGCVWRDMNATHECRTCLLNKQSYRCYELFVSVHTAGWRYGWCDDMRRYFFREYMRRYFKEPCPWIRPI
jgi:hypothetical protein